MCVCVCVCVCVHLASSPGPNFMLKLRERKVGPGVHWQGPSAHVWQEFLFARSPNHMSIYACHLELSIIELHVGLNIASIIFSGQFCTSMILSVLHDNKEPVREWL